MDPLILGGIVLLGWGGVTFVALKSANEKTMQHYNLFKFVGVVSLVLGAGLLLVGLFF